MPPSSEHGFLHESPRKFDEQPMHVPFDGLRSSTYESGNSSSYDAGTAPCHGCESLAHSPLPLERPLLPAVVGECVGCNVGAAVGGGGGAMTGDAVGVPTAAVGSGVGDSVMLCANAVHWRTPNCDSQPQQSRASQSESEAHTVVRSNPQPLKQYNCGVLTIVAPTLL